MEISIKVRGQMFALLQNPQAEQVRMDQRSRRIIPVVKRALVLFAKTSFAIQRGKAGPICLGLLILPIKSINRRKRKEAIPRILCKSRLSRIRGELQRSREGLICNRDGK